MSTRAPAHALLLSALIALAGSAAAVGGLFVAATGPVTHAIEYAPGAGSSCAGSGLAQVVVDLVGNRAAITTETAACGPGYIVLQGGCERTGEGPVTCARDTGTSRIRLTLGADGAFAFTWDDASFTERIEGVLVRA